jgi:hypothetical protein
VNALGDVEQLPDANPPGQDRHVRDETHVLHQRGALAGGILAEHGQLAVVGCQAEDCLERRGLAGAVGSDQTDDTAGRNFEVDVVDGDGSAITLGQPTGGKDRRHWSSFSF